MLQQRIPPARLRIIDPAKSQDAVVLRAVASTTLLITPAGGISTNAPFLPQHATVLTMGFYHAGISAAYDYDSYQFSEMPHFSSVTYPVKKSELIAGSIDKKDPQTRDWGKYVYHSYLVNTTRLGLMVDEIMNNWELFTRDSYV